VIPTEAVDWGYVAFWIVFGVVVATLFLVAYFLFRRWRSKENPGEPF
jgi:Na+/proline symporter